MSDQRSEFETEKLHIFMNTPERALSKLSFIHLTLLSRKEILIFAWHPNQTRRNCFPRKKNNRRIDPDSSNIKPVINQALFRCQGQIFTLITSDGVVNSGRQVHVGLVMAGVVDTTTISHRTHKGKIDFNGAVSESECLFYGSRFSPRNWGMNLAPVLFPGLSNDACDVGVPQLYTDVFVKVIEFKKLQASRHYSAILRHTGWT
jgi:hypothetical protein